jgi:signal transduction histidine kinase
VAATVQLGGDGRVQVVDARGDAALDAGTWVFAADGGVVEAPPGSSGEADREAAALAVRASGVDTLDVGLPDRTRLLALPVRDGAGRIATIVTSTSLAPYEELARLARIGSAVLGVLLMVIVHLVLRANVTRALRPVREMTGQAGRWSADDVDRRFGLAARPAELGGLAVTLDSLLDRVAAALRHEQRLTGELSHELRTPLARVRAELDLIDDRAQHDPVVGAGLASIDAAVTDMQQTIETLLQAGRGGVRTAPGRCHPADVVTALAAETGTAASAPRVVNGVAADLVVGVDGAVLRRLLAPVVDNARRYAARCIEVHGTQSDGAVTLVVDDDGPGMQPDDVERVFAAGWRADPGDGHHGGGLGLALTRRLADACGGSVRAVARAGGGRFEVTLPGG